MRFYSSSATRAPVVVAAPARPRSPIGRWFKTSTDVDVDPGTLALAAHLTKRYGGLAVTIATGIRTRLVAFMARDRDNDDGNVRRYDPEVLETLTAWPGKPGTLLAVLESAGITKDGRVRHWHDLVGNPSPADRRRMVDRDRQRRHRARTAESVTRDTVTKRDSSVTGTVTAAPTYKEHVRAGAQGVEVKTHTPSALRAKTEPRPKVSDDPTAPDALPEAVSILADIWPGAVPASVARRITHEVRDIERWQRTIATWQSAGWHVGTGAIGAMLHRYRQDVDGKRAQVALPAPRPGVHATRIHALPAVPAQVTPTHSPGTPPPTIVPPLPKPATPESRAAFARAFADSPFASSQGRRASRSQCDPRPPTTRPVPDLRSLPPDQRAAVALAALRTIGRAVTSTT